MTDRMTKMVTGSLPDGTLIRACEITFGHLEKQADRIEKLESALDMSEKRFATLKDAWDTLRRRDMPPLYGSAALAGEKKNDG